MRAHLPTEIVHAMSLPTWHLLFAARGYPAGITPKTGSLDVIADVLRDAELPELLARAFFTTCAFATEAGRTDIYRAAAALAYPRRWPDAASPADLVARLLAAATTDEDVAELLAAAKIIRDRSFRPHMTLRYAGRRDADTPMGEPTQFVSAWRERIAPALASFDFGVVTGVYLRASPGVVSFEIVHEGRRDTYVGAGKGSKPTAVRSLCSHLVSYEAGGRALSITTAHPELATPMATLAGTIAFDDPKYFFETHAVDLWKLQELAEDALSIPELSHKLSVTAVGGTWHSGKGHAMTPRGKFFFKALARYKMRIEGGWLELVTLRAKLPANGGAPTECDIALRPPHQVTVSEPEVAAVMYEFLDAAKITNPEPRERDFWSDQPWILTLTEWTAREGAKGVRWLERREILKADASNRAVAPPENPHGARSATGYPLAHGKFLAWSPDPTVMPFLVDERDLVVYALKFGALATMIAKTMGLDDPAGKLDDDGLLFLGHRMLGGTRVYVYLQTRPIRAATEKRLSDGAGAGHAVLVLPRGRFTKTPLRQIAMPKLAGAWHPLLGEIVRAFRLESSVETTVYAPPDARVVFHRATTRLWIDGVHCARVKEKQLRLMELMIDRVGHVMHTKDIAEHIAQGGQHVDTTRHAFTALEEEIIESFVGLKKKPPADLESFVLKPQLGRYTLGVKAFVE